MSVKYIKTPHLPERKVGLLALGERYRRALEPALLARGVEPLWLPDTPGVDTRLAGHADLALFHAGGATVVSAGTPDADDDLARRGFTVLRAGSPLGKTYPLDARLCGCLVETVFLHDERITDRAVLRALPDGVKIARTRQGYTKCAACVVDSRSIITADAGVARAAEGAGLDVLRIAPGHIELESFGHGFIGGAAFKLARDTLAFTGRMDAHPDWARMEAFLRSRSVEPAFLTDMPAFDIGSALPLSER